MKLELLEQPQAERLSMEVEVLVLVLVLVRLPATSMEVEVLPVASAQVPENQPMNLRATQHQSICLVAP